jgi:hypothetical protein
MLHGQGRGEMGLQGEELVEYRLGLVALLERVLLFFIGL